MILSLFLDIAPPRVRCSTFDPYQATEAHSIPILHRVNVQSMHSRQVTPVLCILCDTHLSSRGSLAGVNKAYVFFQATHVGSLISFGVRTKKGMKDNDVEIHHHFPISFSLIYKFTPIGLKKQEVQKKNPQMISLRVLRCEGHQDFIEREG